MKNIVLFYKKVKNRNGTFKHLTLWKANLNNRNIQKWLDELNSNSRTRFYESKKYNLEVEKGRKEIIIDLLQNKHTYSFHFNECFNKPFNNVPDELHEVIRSKAVISNLS